VFFLKDKKNVFNIRSDYDFVGELASETKKTNRDNEDDEKHTKNIRISTDILWRLFHILSKPVPYTFVTLYQ